MALQFNETTKFESGASFPNSKIESLQIEPTTTEMMKFTTKSETPTTELLTTTTFSKIQDKFTLLENSSFPIPVLTTVTTKSTTTSTITTSAKSLDFTTISQRSKDSRRVSKKTWIIKFHNL